MPGIWHLNHDCRAEFWSMKRRRSADVRPTGISDRSTEALRSLKGHSRSRNSRDYGCMWHLLAPCSVPEWKSRPGPALIQLSVQRRYSKKIAINAVRAKSGWRSFSEETVLKKWVDIFREVSSRSGRGNMWESLREDETVVLTEMEKGTMESWVREA